ncbi:MAG: DsbA family protein [Arenicella sp.]
MPDNQTTLYYVYDPMCSWCWAFQPTWEQLQEQLPSSIQIRYILGGLAPDTNQPMPIQMQESIAGIWQQIQATVPGTRFNFDFWRICQPRRSTYPACRAVLAAADLNPQSEVKMIKAIQSAYYLEAKNPSDDEVLVELARNIGLDDALFHQSLNSVSIQQRLADHLTHSQALGARGFPSLYLELFDKQRYPIGIDYNSPSTILKHILKQITAATH